MVWCPQIFFLDLSQQDFESFFSGIVLHLSEENFIQNRKFHVKNYEDCFIASELVEDLILDFKTLQESFYNDHQRQDCLITSNIG
jgi:hypothetical protein